jgi:hypothetical protein
MQSVEHADHAVAVEHRAARRGGSKRTRYEQRAAERRKSQIERQIISTGAQVLKRGLLNTLLGRK